MSTVASHSGKIMVFAPKIRNFSSVGFFPLTFGVSELETVIIKLRGGIGYIGPSKKLKKYYHQVTRMFPALGSTRTLTLDLETIEALSTISKFLFRLPSPFYNLKYVKVPQGYNESCISTCLKFYLVALEKPPLSLHCLEMS